MSFSSLISRSVIQRLNLYNSLFSLSNSSHFSTLLYFYFPFYPSPLILLKSRPFIFSLFLLRCAMSCLLTFFLCDSFRISCLSIIHSVTLSRSLGFLLSDSFVAAHAALVTEADTNCHCGPGQRGI